MPLLLGLAAVAAGVLLWDRWADWSTWSTTWSTWGSTGAVSAPGAAVADNAPSDSAASGGDEDAGREGHSPHPLASLRLDNLRDTVRRPLFEKARRPPEPPTRATAAPPPAPVVPKRQIDPNALTLLGVLTSDGPGAGAIALVRRNQTGQSVRLQEGDTVDGWTIERIEAARVLIRQGDAQIALELFRKR